MREERASKTYTIAAESIEVLVVVVTSPVRHTIVEVDSGLCSTRRRESACCGRLQPQVTIGTPVPNAKYIANLHPLGPLVPSMDNIALILLPFPPHSALVFVS
jgi:hypothetical protein